jgi:hypothetical protein
MHSDGERSQEHIDDFKLISFAGANSMLKHLLKALQLHEQETLQQKSMRISQLRLLSGTVEA